MPKAPKFATSVHPAAKAVVKVAANEVIAVSAVVKAAVNAVIAPSVVVIAVATAAKPTARPTMATLCPPT